MWSRWGRGNTRRRCGSRRRGRRPRGNYSRGRMGMDHWFRCWLCSHRSWRNPLRPPTKVHRIAAVFIPARLAWFCRSLPRHDGRPGFSMNDAHAADLSRHNSGLGFSVNYPAIASLPRYAYVAAPFWSFHVVIGKHPPRPSVRTPWRKCRESGIAHNRSRRRRRWRMKSRRRIYQSWTPPPAMPSAWLPHPS